MFPTLIIADPHFTANPLDEYRWGIFKWARQQITEYKVKRFLILGDLTHQKDNHPSILVNRLVQELFELTNQVQVDILLGNHDYRDPANPFFKFLNRIERIHFWCSIGIRELDDGSRELFLPHTRNWQEDWKAYQKTFSAYKRIYVHQTFKGATSPSDFVFDGVPTSVFDDVNEDCKILSGDIHRRQKVGPVIYIGEPYDTDFDVPTSVRPRVILDDGEKLSSLYFDTVRRIHAHVKEPEEIKKYNLQPRDQVKITFDIARHEHGWFRRYREEVAVLVGAVGAVLCGVVLGGKGAVAGEVSAVKEGANKKLTTTEMFDKFTSENKVDDELVIIGREFLDGPTNRRTS